MGVLRCEWLTHGGNFNLWFAMGSLGFFVLGLWCGFFEGVCSKG